MIEKTNVTTLPIIITSYYFDRTNESIILLEHISENACPIFEPGKKHFDHFNNINLIFTKTKSGQINLVVSPWRILLMLSQTTIIIINK